MKNSLLQSDEEGFTLLEVVVAFAVLALSLIAINKSVALATTQIRRAEEVRLAEELAQGILADYIMSDTKIPKAAHGISGSGLRWRLSGSKAEATHGWRIVRIKLEIFAVSTRAIRSYTTFLPSEVVEE